MKIIRFFREFNDSIKARLIIMFVLLSILPLTLVAVFSYTKSKTAMDEKIKYYSMLSSVEVSTNIKSLIENYDSSSQQFNTDTGLNQDVIYSFDNNISESERYNSQLLLNNKITALQGVRSDIVSIVFISIKNKIAGRFSDYWSSLPKENIFKTAAYVNTINETNKCSFIMPSANTANNKSSLNLMVARSVSDVLGNLLGVVVLEINRKFLDEICNPLQDGKRNNYSFIIDSKGNLVSYYDESKIGQNISSLFSGMDETARIINLNNAFDSFDATFEGRLVLVNVRKITNDGTFRLLNIVDKSYLYQESNNALKWTILFSTICVILTIILGITFSNIFTKPIVHLMNLMKIVENGDLSARAEVENNDEIGKLSKSFNVMIQKLGNSLQEVIKNAENTKLLYDYLKKQVEEQAKLLDGESSIEIAAEDLKENVYEINEIIEMNRSLENKITKQTNEIKEKNHKIMDSISYAKIIQLSILPRQEVIQKNIRESFVLWLPKDIVGGDLYWFGQFGDNYIISCIDCTGHGVPGAVMTMTASSVLNRVTSEQYNNNPAKILQQMNKHVRIALNNQFTLDASENMALMADNGMDIGICYVMPKKKKLIYSGAKLLLFMCKDGKITVIRGDKQGIGYKRSKEDFEYTNHEIAIDGNEVFYLASDGFYDQLGGEYGFGIGREKFSEILIANYMKPFSEQKAALEQFLKSYQGNEEQTDDITVIGFSV